MEPREQELADLQTSSFAGNVVSDFLDDGMVQSTVNEVKVRVCGICYHLYQLLDKARHLILVRRQEEDEIRDDEHIELTAENKFHYEQVHDKHQAQHLKQSLVATSSTPSYRFVSKKHLKRNGSRNGGTSDKASMPQETRRANLKFPAGAKGMVCHADDWISEKAQKILEANGFEVCTVKEVVDETLRELRCFDVFVVGCFARSREEITKWLRAQKIVRFADAPLPMVSLVSKCR